MFVPFFSAQRKMRRHASNWLELAEKIEHYRRDVLEADELAELQHERETLQALMAEKAEAGKIKLGIENLEGVLRKTGGTFYPKSTLVEYVEFFLVAAIVILGIRAFFFQPFKIPTNSMWPSYNGLVGEVFVTPEDEPGVVAQGFRFLTQLAKPHRIDATRSGEVRVPVVKTNSSRKKEMVNFVPYRLVPGRKWFVFPTQLREYEIYVDNRPIKVTVPGDFDLDRVLLEAFFDGADRFPLQDDAPQNRGWLIPTGRHVKQGERILAFDVMTGDQLFVDRISYHFVQPSVGDGFVFRTDHITELHQQMSGPKEQYYIKRLVGLPGDSLEIQEPVLLRNGEPITGADAFAANASRVNDYPGYRNIGLLAEGQTLTVPEHRYLAMGDNSASSLDGRYWGTVPAADVVGRPLFIYYPFSRHWGLAP